jgi:hypothetical protein
MTVKVDSFEIHWEKEGEMCNFDNNVSTPNCQICNYCSPPASYGDPPCLLPPPGEDSGYPFKIVADYSFIPTETPETILEMYGSLILGGCNRPNNPQPIFEPAQGGIYRTMSSKPEFLVKGDTDGEIKVQLVETGQNMAQTTAYQLTPRSIDGTNYWTWATEGSSLWMENFSPNLRVKDVHIYRGACADGSMQGKQCAVPTERIPVKPSRLLFLPDFQGTVSGYQGEAQHRCYGNASANSDNSISVKSCRETYNATQTLQKDVTPTYEVIPDRSTEKMTWFIEFNTNEGADADLETPGNQPMANDADLIVEYTIEAI